MVMTEKIRSLTKQIMVVISAHTILFMVFSYAHEKIDLLYEIKVYMPILAIFCLLPLILVFILSTKYARQGAILLLGILPAAIIYNIVNRFTALPFYTNLEPALIWKILYEGAFGLVLVLEVIGCWLTLRSLQEIHKQIDLPIESAYERKSKTKELKRQVSSRNKIRKKKR
jgi:hypothetical protein